MTAVIEQDVVRFRSFEQYKKYYAPTEPLPDYTGKSNEYIAGAEAVRKAFERAKQHMEESNGQHPQEK